MRDARDHAPRGAQNGTLAVVPTQTRALADWWTTIGGKALPFDADCERHQIRRWQLREETDPRETRPWHRFQVFVFLPFLSRFSLVGIGATPEEALRSAAEDLDEIVKEERRMLRAGER